MNLLLKYILRFFSDERLTIFFLLEDEVCTAYVLSPVHAHLLPRHGMVFTGQLNKFRRRFGHTKKCDNVKMKSCQCGILFANLNLLSNMGFEVSMKFKPNSGSIAYFRPTAVEQTSPDPRKSPIRNSDFD